MRNLIHSNDIGNRKPFQPLTWKDLEDRHACVEWLWDGWIAQGMTTMVAGAPSTGKSFAVLSFVKTVLHGGNWPDGLPSVHRSDNCTVLWIETEGGEPLNIPRARAMGIDLSRVVTIRDEDTDGKPVDFADREDLQHIERIASDPSVSLIVVDSLSGGHNTNENENGAGKVVQGLTQVAGRTGKPLVLVHHLNKGGWSTDTPTIAHVRGNGSQLQYPRIVVNVDAPDPNNPDVRRMTCTKNNLRVKPGPLGFVLYEDGPQWCEAPTAPSAKRGGSVREERDEQIYRMTTEGKTYREIVAELGVSIGTVADAVKRAKARRGIDTNNEEHRDDDPG